jgi:hypothetical protein
MGTLGSLLDMIGNYQNLNIIALIIVYDSNPFFFQNAGHFEHGRHDTNFDSSVMVPLSFSRRSYNEILDNQSY